MCQIKNAIYCTRLVISGTKVVLFCLITRQLESQDHARIHLARQNSSSSSSSDQSSSYEELLATTACYGHGLTLGVCIKKINVDVANMLTKKSGEWHWRPLSMEKMFSLFWLAKGLSLIILYGLLIWSMSICDRWWGTDGSVTWPAFFESACPFQRHLPTWFCVINHGTVGHIGLYKTWLMQGFVSINTFPCLAP